MCRWTSSRRARCWGCGAGLRRRRFPDPSKMGADGYQLRYMDFPSIIELELAAGRPQDESDAAVRRVPNMSRVDEVREHLLARSIRITWRPSTGSWNGCRTGTQMMNLFDSHGKTALVTGGNGGLGLAMAKGLAGAGANIVVVGRNADKNHAAVVLLRRDFPAVSSMAVECDATKEDQVADAVRKAVASSGGLNTRSTTPA